MNSACLSAPLNLTRIHCHRLLLTILLLASSLLGVTLSAATAATGLRALVVSGNPSVGQTLAQESDLWQRYLRASGFQVESVQQNELESRLGDSIQLLVLPGTRELSASQRDGIVEFVRAGGSLILTGLAGERVRDGAGAPLAEMLRLHYRPLAVEPGGSAWVVIDKPSQLSADIPRMQRISLQLTQPVTLETQRQSIAFWLVGSAAKPDYEAAANNTAIVADAYGAGRFIWYGFTLDGLGGDLDSSEAFSRLLRNSLAYLGNRATLEISPWPDPYQKAILYSMDVEERFGNMQFVHEIEGLDYITYFILTHSAALHENLLREVAGTAAATEDAATGANATSGTAKAEIAVLGGPGEPPRKEQGPANKATAGGEIAVHGNNHEVFRGQPKAQQLERLTNARDYIAKTIGIPPIGFRPPEEAYDFFTAEALVESGYKYLLGNNNPDRAEPRMLNIGQSQLVQFTILNKDDVNLITQAGSPRPDVVLDNYLRDIDMIFNRGGLYVVNFHSQILATRRYLPVLADVVKYVGKQDAWITNGRDLYHWWLERSTVQVKVAQNTRGHLRLTLHNTGEAPTDRISLNLWLPDNHHNLRIESPADGRRVLDYRTERNKITLRVPYLRGSEHVEFSIRWQD